MYLCLHMRIKLTFNSLSTETQQENCAGTAHINNETKMLKVFKNVTLLIKKKKTNLKQISLHT